jgi:hypothetical protein
MLTLAVLTAAPFASAGKFVMPWMCLERCGDNSSAIAQQLATLEAKKSDFTAVAFELFNLGNNSALLANNLTNVAPSIARIGLERHAMVSSYPYPPWFLLAMRSVFKDPQPFIDACIAAAASYNLTGFNVDWEPTSGNGAPAPTPDDTVAYAAFLNALADGLHAHALQVSVDVATWSPIWNLTLIGQTHVDYVMTMNTYTSDWATWQKELAIVLQDIPLSKLVVGMETDVALTSQDVANRFAALDAAGVRQIALWRTPIPDIWWPFLDKFAA